MSSKIKYLVVTVLICLASGGNYVFAFTDITTSYKYKDSVEFIAERQIVQGYEDGTYQPDRYINRAEFLKIITLSSGKYDETKKYSCFKDVPENEWYTAYVCSAKEAGFVTGYPDGTFKPSQQINFVEALKIVEKAFNLNYVQDTDPWYAGMVKAAEIQNVIPLSIQSFGQTITRGEMADLIARFIHLNKGSLDSFLKEKINFRVSYSTLENEILVENDWLHYLDSLSSSQYTKTSFRENIKIPIGIGKLYVGDGEYEVTTNDQVKLNNGVVVEVSSVNKADDGYLILANFYINNQRINFLPVSLAQVTEDYSAKIEVNTLRRVDADPRFFKIKFTSVGAPNTTTDLYNSCKAQGGEEIDCLKYVIFAPMNSEGIKTDGVYNLIYPQGEEKLADYYFNQIKYCLPDVIRETKLSPQIGIVPMRLYYADTRAVTTNKSGIYWPIKKGDESEIIKDADACYDPVIVHELVHFLILPAYISEIINESFAFYNEKHVINQLYDARTSVNNENLTMKVDDVFNDEQSGVKFTFLGVSSEMKHVAVFSVEDTKNRFEMKSLGVAKNTGISMENYTNEKENLVIYVEDVKENYPYEATVSMYNSPPLREFLTCGKYNFESIVGWKKPSGQIMPAFDLENYDDATKTQKPKVDTYIDLKDYLAPQYPWFEYYLRFYSSGACMLRKYEQQNSDALAQSYVIINKYKNSVTGNKNNFTNELFDYFGEAFKLIADEMRLR